MSDEDAEQRLRERLKQRQSDRRKTKEEAASTSVEVSIKASNDIHPITTDQNKDAKNSISNSASMIENSTGGDKDGTTTDMKGDAIKDGDRKRSREGDERKVNENGGGRRRRKRGGRRRRPRREERPGDMHRGDNRGGEIWQNQQQHGYPPHNGRDGPYFYDQHPRGPPGGPGYYDRYPYDYHDHRYPPRGDRHERDYRGGGGPPPPERERDFRRHDRDERMMDNRGNGRDPRDNSRGRSKSRSVSDKSYDSRSVSSSRSRSRSFSRSNSRERCRDEEKNGGSSRSASSSRGKRSSRYRSSSGSRSSSREKESSNKSDGKDDKDAGDAALTKDQRTVFVSQLVMRADESDIRRYFKKKAKCRVNDVIFLKDRRTGRHKGSAYVELAKLEDVPNAVKLSGQVPDFQRFPISIKGSDAEKNYEPDGTLSVNNLASYETSNPSTTTTKPSASSFVSTTNGHNSSSNTTATVSKHNKKFEIQNVYIGSIDRCVTQAQLFALFSQFGSLEKVSLQVDTTTGLSRGFAFLSFRDVKDANLAIQTMSGQQLAGRALKTGWASGILTENVTDEFPEDSADKIGNAHKVLTQLTGSGLMAMASLGLATGVTITASATDGAQASSAIESTAEAAINAALGVSTTDNTSTSPTSTSSDDPKVVKGTPSCIILVHNMFDKDEETDEGWQNDIKEEFVEESSTYGTLSKNEDTGACVLVVHDQPGGMVYAQFETIDMAKLCAEALTGRWFDKRQLRVEYVTEFPHSI